MLATTALALGIAGLGAWWWWPVPQGAAVAVADDTFAQCLFVVEGPDSDVEVLDLSDVDAWDVDREEAFWSQPEALDCATGALSDEERPRALARAFAEDQDRAPELEAVAGYARWLGEEVGPETAVLRLATLLRSLWVAEADGVHPAEVFARAATLAHLEARGELPGYVAWAREEGEPLAGEGSVPALFRYRDAVLDKDSADSAVDAFQKYWELARELGNIAHVSP